MLFQAKVQLSNSLVADNKFAWRDLQSRSSNKKILIESRLLIALGYIFVSYRDTHGDILMFSEKNACRKIYCNVYTEHAFTYIF